MNQINTVGLLVASLLVCLFGSFGMRWWLYNKKINEIKMDYRKEVTQLLKTEPKNLKNIAAKSGWDLATYSTATVKVLQDEVRNTDQAISSFTNRKSASPLRILEEISKIIPKEVKIDVTNFSIQDQSVIIEGETDSFETSEKILTFIKSITSLKSVERKSQENKPGSDGKVVKFSISAVKKEGF